MDDLVAWLRQQLDEDEGDARAAIAVNEQWGGTSQGLDEWRLADIAAKRAILDAHESAEAHTAFGADDWRIGNADGLRDAVKLLASAYADRPGYDEKWR